MTIKLANRLTELRKEHGYSQEELADKLGVSRQAVSKWERAEASPDTDNLIELARIYGVSLDELLEFNKEQSETNKKGVASATVEDNESGKKLHIDINLPKDDDDDDDDDEDDDEDCTKGNHYFKDTNKKEEPKSLGELISSLVTTFLVVIAYVVLGTLFNLWHPLWIMFLLIPLVPSFFNAIAKRKMSRFAWPILVTIVFLTIGCLYGLWHPMWVVFLTIPVYYGIAEIIEKYKKDHSK